MFSLGHFDSYRNFLLIFGDCSHRVEQKQLPNLSFLMISIIIFSIHAELIRIIDTSSFSHKMFQIELSMLRNLCQQISLFWLPLGKKYERIINSK